MALILAAGKLLKLNSWAVSFFIHGGVGIAVLFVTVSKPAEDEIEDPIVIQGPPIMSIPLEYSKPAEENAKEHEPEIISEEAEQELSEPEPEMIRQETAAVLSPLSFEGNIPPSYPRAARRLKYEGTVILLVLISAEGRAAAIEIKKSSGYGILDSAALKAVRTWKFSPACIGGKPVEARVEVPVRFVLNP